MLRRLLLCLALGLGTASAAFAAGPDPGVTVGGQGVAGPGGKVRYVAVGGPGATTKVVARARDGSVLRSATLRGRFGVPAVAFDGEVGGVSADGSTLVLVDTRTGHGDYPLQRRGSVAVLAAESLRARAPLQLPGG